jgi:hypothetical protein
MTNAPENIFASAQEALRVESIVRLYFLDAALRLKLRSLLATGLPVVLDVWRQTQNLDAVVATGIWPFLSYVDLVVGDLALAGGQMGELRAAIRAGRIAEPTRSDGVIVLGTEVSVYAQPGGGKAGDFMHTAGGEQRPHVATMRVLTSLVRPMAPPQERAVRALPPQIAALELADCAPPPAAAALLQAPEGYSQIAQTEVSAFWSQHHTDANQIVYTGEYFAAAEDVCGTLGRLAGVAPATLRMLRGQILLKRPFFAGQEYFVRGRLYRADDSARGVAVISVHAAMQPGVLDERPCTAVRIDTLLG